MEIKILLAQQVKLSVILMLYPIWSILRVKITVLILTVKTPSITRGDYFMFKLFPKLNIFKNQWKNIVSFHKML